jgi:mannose-6-phosphate isomerase-like protein (cupin superfamily)
LDNEIQFKAPALRLFIRSRDGKKCSVVRAIPVPLRDMNIYPAHTAQEHLTAERCFIAELFNRPGQALSSVARARVEPGVTTANHLLRGTEEQYYILTGQGELFLNGQSVGQVSSGDIAHIPADTPQCIRNTGTTDLIFLCICTPPFRQEAYEAVV